MNVWVLAGATAAAAMIAGGIPLLRQVHENANLMRRLTGIAAGILLASALMVVIPEGFDIAGEYAGLALLAGFLVMLIFESFGFGHDIHDDHHEHHEHPPAQANSVVLGLSVHALTDGLAIGAAIASGSTLLTMTILIAVIAHKIPAAFSVGVFCVHEREHSKRAAIDILLFSLATPAAILLTFFATDGLPLEQLGLAILFAGGTFLYVATVDVLPDIHHAETGKAALFQILIGAALMIGFLFGLEATGLLAH